MSKSKTINFQRVTFSFPKEVIHHLREKVANNQMSSYVADLVKKDLEKRESISVDLMGQLANFRTSLPKQKTYSLDLLRQIRYE